jgi:NAD(P)H-dependent flavin oxidoreductase YrpB (nitropropane dioxygenase family)
MLTKAALVDGRLDAGVLPTGQVVGVIDALPTVAAIVELVMHEAEQVLVRFGAG